MGDLHSPPSEDSTLVVPLRITLLPGMFRPQGNKPCCVPTCVTPARWDRRGDIRSYTCSGYDRHTLRIHIRSVRIPGGNSLNFSNMSPEGA